MRNVRISKYSMTVENLLEILNKRGSQTFFKAINVYSVTNAVGKSISSVIMWNTGNQLGKHDFSCGSEVNI